MTHIWLQLFLTFSLLCGGRSTGDVDAEALVDTVADTIAEVEAETLGDTLGDVEGEALVDKTG